MTKVEKWQQWKVKTDEKWQQIKYDQRWYLNIVKCVKWLTVRNYEIWQNMKYGKIWRVTTDEMLLKKLVGDKDQFYFQSVAWQSC